MTVEDCIIIGGSQLRWYLPSVAPRTSTVWYGVIFLSETRRQLVHRHNLPPAQMNDAMRSFKYVKTFNMDEYVGISEDHPESYHK